MLKGKSAIITGSTSGIGLGIASALAAEGCDVMLNGFGDPAETERLRAELAEQHGARTAYSPADMTKPAEIRELIAETERHFGGVDILVNNAGIQHVAPMVKFPDEQAREDLVRVKQPMLDYATPEKIAALAVFLCGDAASTITGAALSIDGGWVAQ